MRIYKNKLFTLATVMSACLCMTFSSAYANQKPVKCPSAAAIIAGGLDAVGRTLFGNSWGGVKHSRYDTAEEWGLIIGGVLADNKEEAKQQLLALLATVKLRGGPEETMWPDTWVCFYSLPGDVVDVYALTPVRGDILILLNSMKGSV